MSYTILSVLSISSPAFANNTYIPVKYTCEGKNINPEIIIDNIPKGTRSLVLIMDDPDAPSGTFDHWIMWNIRPQGRIEENTSPGEQGKNSHDENKYFGPCPPKGMHHYHFRIYALDTLLDLSHNTNKRMLQRAMDGHILASGELVGLFGRK